MNEQEFFLNQEKKELADFYEKIKPHMNGTEDDSALFEDILGSPHKRFLLRLIKGAFDEAVKAGVHYTDAIINTSSRSRKRKK